MSRKMKCCSTCGKRKALRTGFYKRALNCKTGPGRPYSECKTCHHDRTNELRRFYRKTNPRYVAAARVSAKRYYEKNKKRINRAQRLARARGSR